MNEGLWTKEEERFLLGLCLAARVEQVSSILIIRSTIVYGISTARY